MLYILNAPVLTEFGEYSFRELSESEARELLKGGFQSACGHEATCQFLGELLGVKIPNVRPTIKMAVGDKAIVFWLLERQPEGTILYAPQLRRLQYKLGLLERLE